MEGSDDLRQSAMKRRHAFRGAMLTPDRSARITDGSYQLQAKDVAHPGNADISSARRSQPVPMATCPSFSPSASIGVICGQFFFPGNPTERGTAQPTGNSAKRQNPTRGASGSGRIKLDLNRLAVVAQTACGLNRCTSDPSPNPSFSVSFASSVVKPPDRGSESNHRGLKELREPVDFKGVCCNRPGGRKAVI